MDKRTAGTILALTIILVGGLRLTFALSEPLLAFDGYEELRLAEHIAETGQPLTDDQLAGRERAHSPIYYYLLAPFLLLFDATIALKTIPNLLYLTAIPFVYLIGHEISRNRAASVLAALLAGLTPITFASYLNDADPATLSVTLILAMIYALMRPEARVPLLVAAGVLLSLTSPLIFLVIGGLMLYHLIAALEGLAIDDAYGETLFFLLFFGLWSTLLIYKEAFLEAGFGALWAYIPESVLTQYYADFTIVTAIATIGVLPLIFGGHAAYHALFLRRSKRALLVLGIAAATLAALLLRVVQLETGIVVLTFMLCILAAHGLGIMFRYFEKTRAPRARYAVTTIILLFFVFASVLPALSQAANEVEDTPTPAHLGAAEHLAGTDALLLAAPEEGSFFQYHDVATLTDRDFLLAEEADEHYRATEEIYRSRFVLPVLERTEEFGITHLLVSDIVRERYGRDQPLFLPHDCFPIQYTDGSLSIYEVTCSVKTT